MNKRYCKICGKTLKKNHKFYCSRECFCESQRGKDGSKWNRIRRICKQCGEKFYTVPSQITQMRQGIKSSGGKFCSQKCVNKYMKGKNHGMWKKKIKKVCPICGKRFEVQPSNKRIQYCSKQCYYKWRKSGGYSGEKNPCWKPKVKKTCELCGKQFAVKPARKDTAKFCSYRCLGLSNYLKQIRNPNYRQPLIEILIENELQRLDIPYQKQVLLCAIAVVDFYLPDDKTIIQCDDRFHLKPDAIERDDNQDTILTSQGYRVFRLEEKEINKSPFYSLRKVLLRMRA